MRQFLFLFAALPALALASFTRRQQVPVCADGCSTNVPTGNCSIIDLLCLCENPTYVQSYTSCLESSCSGSELTQAEAAAEALCKEAGATQSASVSGSGLNAPGTTVEQSTTNGLGPTANPSTSGAQSTSPGIFPSPTTSTGSSSPGLTGLHNSASSSHITVLSGVTGLGVILASLAL